ncbi:DUF6919 domain-containing protein [Kribbella sp. NPDC059898]|uniref:DUF6919 domain-containing protein n=1 Tax=Kribbella sp. NPDC059898 TaxID=3346995 RepID=UPI003666E136
MTRLGPRQQDEMDAFLAGLEDSRDGQPFAAGLQKTETLAAQYEAGYDYYSVIDQRIAVLLLTAATDVGMNFARPESAVTHIVGPWQHWLDRLGVKPPRARCGVRPADGPDVCVGKVCSECTQPRAWSPLGLFRGRRRRRRQVAEAARRWTTAASFRQLCDLNAQWLEGQLAWHPNGQGEPDLETLELAPVLVAANRAGFLTDQAQQAIFDLDDDGHGGKVSLDHRAAVQGYVVDEHLVQALTSTARYYGLRCIVNRPSNNDREPEPVAVTRRAGRTVTEFGVRALPSDIQRSYGSWCSRGASAAMNAAYQVTIVDQDWGSSAVLWPALLKALTAAATTARTSPALSDRP